MRASLVVAVAGAVLLLAKGAAADRAPPLGDAIEVDPALCFAGGDLAARIQHWATSPIDPRVHVRVMREATHVSFVAFVLLRDGEVVGERSLELPDAACGDSADAVALAIALALDANQGEATAAAQVPMPDAPPTKVPDSPPTKVPDSPPTKVPDAHLPDAVSALSTARPTEETGASVSATALASVGVLAHAAAGLAVGVDKAWTRALEMHLEVFGVSETSQPVYGAAGESLSTTLLATVLDGCAGMSVAAARLRVCAGPTLGVVLSSAGGIQIAPIGWLGPSARLDGSVALTRSLSFVASVDGFAPLLREVREVHSGGGELFPSVPPLPAYGLTAGGGLAFNF